VVIIDALRYSRLSKQYQLLPTVSHQLLPVYFLPLRVNLLGLAIKRIEELR
jgi:hypothetical protein